jgi:polyisoprenyl-teichoic acid--peptidoglycan teichoic acid transferase
VSAWTQEPGWEYSHNVPALTSTAPSAQVDLTMTLAATAPVPSRTRFRRAVKLLLMTLVAPGFAQLSAGSRRVGWLALGTAAAVVGTTMLLAASWLVNPRWLLWLVSWGPVLPLIRSLMFLLALGWVALFVDAWRLGRPLTLRRDQRLKVFGLTTALSVLTAAALTVTAGYINGGHRLLSAVFGDGSGEGEKAGRYNVLLLGGDAGRTRSGLRPDSITVASVDARSGDAVLFGLPRNLQNVPFPEGSVMHEQWPNGFDCGEECLLNGIYTWAESHSDLFPDVQRPGVEATRAAVEAITGLEIGYTVMIDLQGFRHLVDATGGVTVDVRKQVPLGGPDGGPIYGWIEKGPQHMDGATALWFARSRRDSSDYERMARQKCVLSAMLKQLDPGTVLTSFQALATASARTVWTDVPATDLNDLINVAMRAKDKPPRTVNLVPPLVKPSNPDFEQIRMIVKEAMSMSDGSADVTSGGPGASTARPDQQSTSTTTAQAVAREVASAAPSEETEPICSIPRR